MDAQAQGGGSTASAGQLWIWLPELYGTGSSIACEQDYPMVARLAPGFPRRLFRPCTAACYVPENLPYAPEEMAAYVLDLERFLAENARDTALFEAQVQRLKDEEERRAREERAAVEDLLHGEDAGESACRREKMLRARAQRLLAWCWLQQKNAADMAGIVDRINSSVASMKASFAAERTEDFGALAGLGDFAVAREDDAAQGVRMLLEAALVLCPQDTVFVCHRLPAELEEPAARASVCSWSEELGAGVAGIECTADALGITQAGLADRKVRLALVGEAASEAGHHGA